MADELDFSEITLFPELPEPLYLQLADRLHERIKCHSGEKCGLPSLRTLAAAVGCDRSTASKAYGELERRKVISRFSSYKFCALPDARNFRNPFPNIGVVIPRRFSDYVRVEEYNHFIPSYIAGIIDRAAEKNISTLMLQLPPPEAPAEKVEEFLENIALRLDGTIHLGSRSYQHDPPLKKLFDDRRIPQVMISAIPHKNPAIGCVIADITPALQQLTAEFRNSGIRDVALMVWHFHGNRYVKYEASTRYLRMKTVLEENGFSIAPDHFITECINYCNIYNSITALIRRKRLPEVILCQNDQIAIWCVQALERQNIRVPEDVSVVGCDNCSSLPWSERLTTFDMPFYELGSAAVDMLEDIRSGNSHAEFLRYLPAKLELKETLLWKNQQQENRI